MQIPTGFAILKVVDDTDPASRSMNAATSTTLATEANVKYVIDVSGLLEAEAVLQAFPKPDDWNQDPLTICQMRRKSLASSQASLESFLSPERESARRSRSPFDVMQAQFALAQLHAYDGRMDRALVEYQHAYETARSGSAGGDPAHGGSTGRRPPPQGGNGQRHASRAWRSLPVSLCGPGRPTPRPATRSEPSSIFNAS